MATRDLHRRLHAVFQRRAGNTAGSPSTFYVNCGLETRTDPRKYNWDGMHRGGDAAHPMVVLQYTLAGRGAYEQSGAVLDVGPETCFIAVVPSAHRYYLPRTSPSWTFFFFVITHEYAVKRLTEIHRRYGPLHRVAGRSIATARMVAMFSGLCSGAFRDELAAEQSLLDMVLEYERNARQGFFPSHRQQILDEVRHEVLGNLAKSLSVEDLAASAGMSRSHYSHYFRATTGRSPAAYIMDIRLQEVAQRLTHTRQDLKTIAAETGFADANHLCKCFRRHFRTSPGRFRRRLVGGI